MNKDDLVPISIKLSQIYHELKLLRYLREAELYNTPQFEFYKSRCSEDNDLGDHLSDDKLLG